MTFKRDDGFTLAELLISMTITLVILSAAMTTFKNALALNQSATQLSDSNQNLRAGLNMLTRDLQQAARGIGTFGIPIPSGNGSSALHRPAPPTKTLAFDNVTQTTLPAITTGGNQGPSVDGNLTDIITMMMVDNLPISPGQVQPGQLPLNDTTPPLPSCQGSLATNGSYIDTGTCSSWLAGNTAQGISPIKVGDLIWVANGKASNGTLVCVTGITGTKIMLAAGDFFGFNQPSVSQGSIKSLLPTGGAAMTQGWASRVLMITYYVDAVTTPGTPRLTRVINNFTPQALAGVVEDLDLSYDLVDGTVNPVQIKDLPYTSGLLTYSANQIRKVNVHIGVRSDLLSPTQPDYIRNHVGTVVSIRDLAFVNRY